jgi:AcrR family transcriptional regulator
MLSKRQQEIIETSIELIAEKGIQGLTIKNLSKAIGISEPGIYRHFESKTEILVTILDNFRDMAAMLSGLMQHSEDSAINNISFMFNKMVETFVETPSLVAVIFSEEIFKNEEILNNKIVEILNLNEQTIEKILLKGQQQGNVRDDIDEKSLALLVMGSLRLMVKRWDLNKHNFNLQEEGSILLKAIKTLISKQLPADLQ